jgi:hypothetical protein
MEICQRKGVSAIYPCQKNVNELKNKTNEAITSNITHCMSYHMTQVAEYQSDVHFMAALSVNLLFAHPVITILYISEVTGYINVL